MHPLAPLLTMLLSMVLVFGFNYCWMGSAKPVYNNPVVFNDGGNPWWLIPIFLSFVGFVASLIWLGGQ
jgi:hypothetical protein